MAWHNIGWFILFAVFSLVCVYVYACVCVYVVRWKSLFDLCIKRWHVHKRDSRTARAKKWQTRGNITTPHSIFDNRIEKNAKTASIFMESGSVENWFRFAYEAFLTHYAPMLIKQKRARRLMAQAREWETEHWFFSLLFLSCIVSPFSIHSLGAISLLVISFRVSIPIVFFSRLRWYIEHVVRLQTAVVVRKQQQIPIASIESFTTADFQLRVRNKTATNCKTEKLCWNSPKKSSKQRKSLENEWKSKHWSECEPKKNEWNAMKSIEERG